MNVAEKDLSEFVYSLNLAKPVATRLLGALRRADIFTVGQLKFENVLYELPNEPDIGELMVNQIRLALGMPGPMDIRLVRRLSVGG